MARVFWRGFLLRRALRRKYGLKRRKWSTRTAVTPGYAGCYNIPKSWLEGSIGEHVVTFWGGFGWRGFTGDVMVGAFNGDRNATFHRPVRGEPLVPYTRDRPQPELRLPAVQEAARRLSGAVTQLGLDPGAVELKLQRATLPWLYEDVELAAAVVTALLRQPEPPLVTAAEAGDLAGVERALLAGGDPNEPGPFHHRYDDGLQSYRKTPLLLAVMRGDDAIVGLLLARGANPKIDSHVLLALAIRRRRLGALRALLAAGVAVERLLYDQTLDSNLRWPTPLVYASLIGWVDGVRTLLDAGANPEARLETGLGRSPPPPEGPEADAIGALIAAAIARRDRSGRLSLAEVAAADGGLSLARREDESGN